MRPPWRHSGDYETCHSSVMGDDVVVAVVDGFDEARMMMVRQSDSSQL